MSAESGFFSKAAFRQAPVKMLGICLVLLLRYLFGLFHLGAGINKLRSGWPWTDYLRTVFEERLTQLDPASFGAAFLTHFGVPFYLPIAWVVTLVELAVAFSLLAGYATRTGALLAGWLMVMFAIGGYYDASLIPLWAIALLIAALPTGHWLGMDRRLHAARPASRWHR
jgi:thiosulfate dehydrogenase (quinone) large subunit